ncbi:MAG: biotin--[acetyl-CoA-carboxylase] ligase [Bacteroidales bacterium]
MNLFNIIELSQTASTQTYLTNECEHNELEEYTVIFTTNQTSGRGQDAHIWESEKGKNITFSLLLRPVFLHPAEQFLITQFISLSIVDVLQKYGLKNVFIKWPNDIYIDLNKICGILIQNKIIGDSISHTYIGVGINVNQWTFQVAPNPTSLFLETGRQYDLQTFLMDTLNSIYIRYNQLKERKLTTIQKEYLSLLLFRNCWQNYIYKNRKIVAKILNVNRFGHLIMEMLDQTTIECELRQLQFLF